ncbi:MAG TPA: hypothetical protein PLL94_09900 [Bacteroidales bacterium]|nr:hypothetical protein [Bacteroidales bacterium]
MFRSILVSNLSFYPFFYFAQKGELNSKHLIAFFLLMIPVLIGQYYSNMRDIINTRNSNNADLVNNMAYPFVNLIPYIFLIKRRRLFTGALMIILMFFIIQSAKRGAIVVGSIGMLIYFYYNLVIIEKSRRVTDLLIIVFIISCLAVFTYKTLINNEFAFNRMASILEGNTSRRDIIYSRIFYEWYNSNNLLNLLFGFGFASSVEIAGNYAHNDWLELLSNFGIVGILIYINLFFAAFKYSFFGKWSVDKRTLMFVITIMWLSKSSVSMSYTSLNEFLPAILLGYLVGSKVDSLE